ncbi:TetR/AcrR family transcriptional regulator [Phytoactinopolyspora alkaliphila]|uniref:TetR/AcrR family transcriptional regulator n=1 Tax=Phytoactinopolyspora alkaliphila TaxID=1783498 RepID=A0A6N9YR07_9ACTN|nr:TetR/AcrR family transcriptional regulator [Phytoactinopolyspora alkaliphila]NED97414.1 TetR/AcrR family transcriptional regulator [Phytoactinopolyspora alkaliphila]
MPRVSESYLSARRQQILEAAWRCFAKNGFHATSMQDIFAEAGLSAGAVYRYFPSKLDLIKATSESLLGGLDEAFDVVTSADPVPPPNATFRIVIDTIMRRVVTRDTDVSRIAMHVWSEALREPEVGEVARAVVNGVRDRWADMAVRWKAAGHIAPDADEGNVARTCYGLMVGFVVERNLVGDVTCEQYADGLAALTGTSADVAD